MKKRGSILAFLFFISVIGIYFLADNIKQRYSEDLATTIYKQTQVNISKRFDGLFYSNFYKLYDITNQIIDDQNIKEELKKDGKKEFDYISSSNRYITIYNDSYKKIYSSMSEQMAKLNSDHFDFFKKDFTLALDFDISTYNCTLSNIETIVDNDLLGFIQVHTQLDELLKVFSKYNIQPIAILTKTYSSFIDPSYSYSRVFLDDRYIVNKNANRYYIKILEQLNILKSDKTKFFDKKIGIVIVKKEIFSKRLGKVLDIYLLKSSDDMDFSQIKQFKKSVDYVMILCLIIISALFYIIYSNMRVKYLASENERLTKDNKQLQELSAQLDYNEKKLANLFNLQPNIMFISNGVEIVQVNKRFMGFFRRYGTFENFKKHHRSIAELFEPYDEPNYISSQLIEGKNWLEYILEHPKKIYKTVMSVDDKQHHFIIKVNEMKYLRELQERYIVVAFVDITQEIEIRKQLLEKEVQKNETHFDISYILEENISYTIAEFTNILPTKQAIFKGSIDDINIQSFISIKVEFQTDNNSLYWHFIIPFETISFIDNNITANYDAKVKKDLDIEDYLELIEDFISNMCSNISNQINMLNQPDLKDMEYDILSIGHLDKKDDINIDNLYDFTMFLEEQRVDIFIEFDNDSLKYIKQIMLLGMFFDSE